MKQIIFKCALISCLCVLNLVSSANITNLEEEGSDNSTNLLTQFNFSIPLLNMSNINETYPDCYLKKEENGIILIINKTRAEVGEDEYPDYIQVCPVSVYLFSNTMESLIGK